MALTHHVHPESQPPLVFALPSPLRSPAHNVRARDDETHHVREQRRL
jgi:hypothetical protein